MSEVVKVISTGTIGPRGPAGEPGTDGDANVPSYTFATLPPAGTPGRLARLTDNIRGLWRDTGNKWISVTGHADVMDFGAAGDGITNDTVAVQEAADNAEAILFPSSYNFLINEVDIPNTVKLITIDGTITQRTVDVPVFVLQEPDGILIEGSGRFQGVADNRSASPNNAIRIDSLQTTKVVGDCKNVHIRGLTFIQFQYFAVWARYVDGLIIENCFVDRCTHGLGAYTCSNIRIKSNKINESQLSVLSVGISLNTQVNSDPNEQIRDAVISNNVISDRYEGQSILIHSCIKGTVSGNIITNCWQGLHASPADGTRQKVKDLTINHNVFYGTDINTFVGQQGNVGITVGGTSTDTTENVNVVGNVVTHMNHAAQDTEFYGIAVTGAVNKVSINNNVVSDIYGTGIRIAAGSSGSSFSITVISNHIKNILSASGARWGVEFAGNAGNVITGVSSINYIDEVTSAWRVDSTAPNVSGFIISTNFYGSVITNIIHNLSGIGFIEGMLYRENQVGPHPNARLLLGSGNWKVFTDLDTTPSVANGNLFDATNSSATTITNFDDGVTGQLVVIRAGTGFTTIQHSASIRLGPGANFVMSSNDTLTVVKHNNGSWYEIGRST